MKSAVSQRHRKTGSRELDTWDGAQQVNDMRNSLISIDILTFQFASLVEEQPTVDRSVEKRDARLVVKIDEMR